MVIMRISVVLPLFFSVVTALPVAAADFVQPLPSTASLQFSDQPQPNQRDGGDQRDEAPVPPVMFDLHTALEWTLTQNPNLVAQRQDIRVSAEAWAVAQHFPVSLNPTVSLDLRPWTFGPAQGGATDPLQTLVNITWSQPIELGHRTALRASIAQANYDQTRFVVLQAELTALVQTYRLHQTALYRRDKLKVARELVEFNDRLVQTLQRQVEATRAASADLVLAQVESHSTRQQLEIATHEYVVSLSDLRSHLGIPEYAVSAVPNDTLTLPAAMTLEHDEALIHMAVSNRPEILAAQAAVTASRNAVALARADRIPIPSVGPTYEKDEAGISYYGFTATMPIPVLNAGGPLVRQREAEYHRNCVVLAQLRQQTTAQVQATLVKWHDAQDLVHRTQTLVEFVRKQNTQMEHLYAAGEADIIKLLQVRQRLLETDNGQLDALWAATQGYADLLDAVGAVSLLGGLTEKTPE
jgi:cobalt-zinc-cadmium efflux system outer membrane protein